MSIDRSTSRRPTVLRTIARWSGTALVVGLVLGIALTQLGVSDAGSEALEGYVMLASLAGYPTSEVLGGVLSPFKSTTAWTAYVALVPAVNFALIGAVLGLVAHRLRRARLKEVR